MKKILIALSALAMLSACETATKEKLGLVKKAPNEFMVSTKAPLTMPPEADIVPVTPAPSVQPQITLKNVSKEEAAFMAHFNESSTVAKIDEISEAIDKELQRFKQNG